MREMKDSGVEWIGEIPASWSIISTKFLFNVLSGATPESTKAEKARNEKSAQRIKERRKENPDYARPEREFRKNQAK